MNFENAWKEHLNRRGDKATLDMIEKYGIDSVESMCMLAYEIGKYDASGEIQQVCACT